jgi:hypothetical protein
MDWIDLAQDRDQWMDLVKMVMPSGFIKCLEVPSSMEVDSFVYVNLL